MTSNSDPPSRESLTFFTATDSRYEPFVLPYLASALHHNSAACAEVRLESPERFAVGNAQALDLLSRRFPGRFALSGLTPMPGVHVSTLRFLETPQQETEFVYIGDIDILILEEVAPAHIAHMERAGLPYSNVRRPNAPRLTGLHFTRWDAYYPPVELTAEGRRAGDEAVLHSLVKQRGLALPDPADTFRPDHGYHLSITRNTAGGLPPWGGLRSEQLVANYLALTMSPWWQELAPLFDVRYRQLLSMLDIVLAHLFPEVTRGREPPDGTLPRDWW